MQILLELRNVCHTKLFSEYVTELSDYVKEYSGVPTIRTGQNYNNSRWSRSRSRTPATT